MELMGYIAQQPDVWRQILAARATLTDEFRDLCRRVQPDRFELIGSGTSYHAGWTACRMFSDWTGTEAAVQYPSLAEDGPRAAKNPLVIGVSQTGASTAVVDGMSRAHRSGFSTVAVTAVPDSPLARECDVVVPIRCGEELAGPKTKGYTATVLTLYLMAAAAAGQADDRLGRLAGAVSRAADRAERIIRESDRWYQENRRELAGAGHLAVVGDGVNYGTALESALKLLETVRCPVSGYEFEEYLHGPYNALGPDSTLFFLNPAGRNQQRMFRMIDFALSVAPRCYAVTDDPARADGRNLILERTDDPETVPLLYILPMQVLAARLSADRGIQAFFPRYRDFHQRMGSKL